MKRQHLIRQWWTLMLAVQLGPVALAQSDAHWVATWASSQLQRRVAPRPPATPPVTPPPVTPFAGSFNNQTVRMIVRTSIGGRRVRVQLSQHLLGAAALTVGSVAHCHPQ